ncbi:hypothetical protein CS8_091200 [Cupriavidus sp. 8B]
MAAKILALVNEILRAKGLLLRAGTAVDATLISAQKFDQECVRRTRPGNAPEQEDQPMVLWHESARAI